DPWPRLSARTKPPELPRVGVTIAFSERRLLTSEWNGVEEPVAQGCELGARLSQV
ncbi:MAG: hypothetical protein QOJ09_1653, partial [Actinomycetota bacterium]|nr:hypothetical protein [Actinomycetota bacterium]